ncbi:iron ABC transporter permease [Micrococcus sp. CH3]|uniref:ABC transporter permease n=1 Tax=Micrococcus sp. CH3 TaxID=1770209 RepID=UPI00077DF197|nr:iron ABC transporter permease [Micrococcus sp. CH3]KYK02140.1 iron ABC transporter permease [Micrococcus sp. CH3]
MAAAVALVPIGYLFLRTAQGGFGPWLDAVVSPRVGALAATSLALTAVVTALCLVIGVGAAWLVTRTDTPGRGLLAVLLALPLAVPSYVAAFTWVSVSDLLPGVEAGRFEGFWAAVTVMTLYTYPYVYLPVAAALSRIDPGQEDVARSLGRGPAATLFTVTLAQVRPAIAGGALLVALYVLSDFGAVAILRLDTFTRAIFTALEVGFNRQLALTLATVLVLLTVLVLWGESRTRRADDGVRSGRTVRRVSVHRLGRSRWVGTGLLAVVTGAALGVPAVSLVRWMGEGTSLSAVRDRWLDAVSGSVVLAGPGAALTLALALPIGILAARHPGRVSRIAERAAFLAHGLPGVVVGLSLVFLGVSLVPALYQTTWMVAFAYATLFLPLAVTSVAGAVAQSSPALEEAARSLGSSGAEVLRRVTLPLALPGVGAGVALVALTAMKELPATLLLRPTGMDTLATRLWNATSVGRYAEAAPYALTLVLLAAVPTWVVVHRRGIVAAVRGRSSAPSTPNEVSE